MEIFIPGEREIVMRQFDEDFALLHGDKVAYLLHHLHFWLTRTKSGRVIKGQRWIYSSIENWQAWFPWLGEKTIRRNLDYMVEQELIFRGTFPEYGTGRTKWYTINYAHEDIIGSPYNFIGQNVHIKRSKRPDITDKMTNSSGQNDQSLNTETKPERNQNKTTRSKVGRWILQLSPEYKRQVECYVQNQMASATNIRNPDAYEYAIKKRIYEKVQGISDHTDFEFNEDEAEYHRKLDKKMLGENDD